jgi:dUTP pyrophosphatase
MSVLSVQKIHENSKVPIYDKINQYTLFSSEDMFIPQNKIVAVPIGIRLAFPRNYCAFIVDGYNFHSVGGLVDSDYRGEIKAVIYSPIDAHVKKGDPIARMILIEIALPTFKTEDYLKEMETEDENTICNEN